MNLPASLGMQSAALSMAGPWQNSTTRLRARLLRQKWRKCGRVGMTEDRARRVVCAESTNSPQKQNIGKRREPEGPMSDARRGKGLRRAGSRAQWKLSHGPLHEGKYGSDAVSPQIAARS